MSIADYLSQAQKNFAKAMPYDNHGLQVRATEAQERIAASLEHIEALLVEFSKPTHLKAPHED